MNRGKLIRVARGECPPDLVLKEAQVVDLLTGEIYLADVAICDGLIAGVGSYSGPNEVDLGGMYLAPGFVNAHCHVESAMVTPPAYCQEELGWGTTTLVTDPHEIANVAGVEGIRFMLSASERLPMNYYVMAPSCVPSTPFEDAGAVLDAAALAPLLSEPRVRGLGELMNYPGLLSCDADVLAKLDAFAGRVCDGHAPGLCGKDLQAYAAAGVATDHECTTFAETHEKLRAGMAVLIREGSAGRHLADILPGLLQAGIATDRVAFCTDDKHLSDLRREGGVRWNIRQAIALGCDPIDAYRMGSLNAARIYGLPRIGAIAPGYKADLVVLEDLRAVDICAVYKDGVRYERGTFGLGLVGNLNIPNSVQLAPLSEQAFALPVRESYPVVGLQADTLVTEKRMYPADNVDTMLAAGELLRLAVIERHHATGKIGVGLLAGYGRLRGAIAGTVSHDSHNLIVVGSNDADMRLAVAEIERMQGGFVVVSDGQVQASLPLPLYGLMCDLDADELTARLDTLIAAAHTAGVADKIEPFIALSFLALPVIPEIRVTDRGVFDVTSFSFL